MTTERKPPEWIARLREPGIDAIARIIAQPSRGISRELTHQIHNPLIGYQTALGKGLSDSKVGVPPSPLLAALRESITLPWGRSIPPAWKPPHYELPTELFRAIAHPKLLYSDHTQNAFREIRRHALPERLRSLHDVTLFDILEVAEQDGIPLYVVPRPSIARSLLKAQTTAKRRAILGRKSDAIVDDCEAVLAECLDVQETMYVQEAIDSIRNHHHAAAQALAANLLDSMLGRMLTDKDKKLVISQQHGSPRKKLTDYGLTIAYVMLPIWRAHAKFRISTGDPVPREFSRHATVHAVSNRQFSKRNTVQALMLVTTLVVFASEL